jgi:predicted amidophosphoribosyltransferase
MRCETCHTLLDADDNYCRKCGAPVQIAPVPAVRQAQPPALFRSTAAPLATGAAAVAATAVLKWAVRQAVRGILAGDMPRRSLARREPEPVVPVRAARQPRGVVEIFWYRRTFED